MVGKLYLIISYVYNNIICLSLFLLDRKRGGSATTLSLYFRSAKDVSLLRLSFYIDTYCFCVDLHRIIFIVLL